MSSISLHSTGSRRTRFFAVATALAGACAVLQACSNAPQIPPAERPLPKETMSLLGKKGMDAESPLFVRIFKEESELEVWKARDDGRFYHFKTYPICNWSGELGPKLQQGDKQAPEGFYTVATGQMNPNSGFHLAFNLGYPNAYDKAHRRTGEFLMVHGKCKSAGCYAMTDALMEEIYALARESFKGGQGTFPVHAFPFRMTEANMARHRTHKWHAFWQTLKEGYDHFEQARVPPTVAVCARKYVINVKLPSSPLNPEGACPIFEKPLVEPFRPLPGAQQVAEERVVVPGPRLRSVADSAGGISAGAVFGLGFGGHASETRLGLSAN
jgi:murein L,D-transpeptidase YafK